jgi:hypothetical protein
MYLRVIKCHLKQGVAQESAANVYHELLPAIVAYDGCLGTSLMVNEATHTAVAFIYWDSKEHACAAGKHLRPLLFNHTWELTDAPLDIAGFQVMHHSMLER